MRLLILFFLLIIYACDKGTKDEEFVCDFVSPGLGTILENDIPVEIRISASHDIDRVDYLIDDERIDTISTLPFKVTWTPKSLPGGVHTLKAIVYPYDFDSLIVSRPVTFRYYSGDMLQGGIILQTDETGAHGLVVATEDFTRNSKMNLLWGSEDFIGATDTANGKENTKILANSQLTEDYLWKSFKFNFIFKGYDDWYVPARTEIRMINAYVLTPETKITMEGLYWTSTECCRANACAFDFDSHVAVTALKAHNLFRIRLVRKF